MVRQTYKGFVNDLNGNRLLPITRGELVLDENGNLAFTSALFEAGKLGDYGLISKSDLNKLRGSIGEGDVNIGDLSTKIDYINQGIKVGNTVLHYYTIGDNNIITSTPISFASNGSLSITAANNTITIGLPKTSNDQDIANLTNTFIRAITVDKYGIVKSVSGSTLVNADIPATLEGKTLSGCTTESVADNNNAIVNKKYVDDKVTKSNIANIGALIFGGTITNVIYTNNEYSILNANNVNHYYKVTESFTILKEHLYSEDSNITVKSGDTLIIYNNKTSDKDHYQFVYVPSADEKPTTITVTPTNNNESKTLTGDINLVFAGGGLVTTVTDNKIQVELPAASATENGYLTKDLYTNIAQAASGSTNGYLTAEDYVKFSSAAAKSITFTPTLTTGYEIGTFTFDENSSVKLYGKDTTYSLALNQSTSDSDVNPKISFTGSNSSTKDITFVGDGTYTQVSKTDDSHIKIAAVTGEGGLVTYQEYKSTKDTLSTLVNVSTYFYKIEESLILKSDEDATKRTYYYGSNALKEAVTITI